MKAELSRFIARTNELLDTLEGMVLRHAEVPLNAYRDSIKALVNQVRGGLDGFTDLVEQQEIVAGDTVRLRNGSQLRMAVGRTETDYKGVTTAEVFWSPDCHSVRCTTIPVAALKKD